MMISLNLLMLHKPLILAKIIVHSPQKQILALISNSVLLSPRPYRITYLNSMPQQVRHLLLLLLIYYWAPINRSNHSPLFLNKTLMIYSP